MKYRRQRDILLSEINAAVIEEYEAWLRASGVKRNTSSFYMRNLHALYSQAIEKGLVIDARPFAHVYRGVNKTSKRAISIAEMRRLRDLDLSQMPALEFARDMLMFSFYARGMSFVDMAYLKASDVEMGCITYFRSKTHQRLQVEVVPQMQAILDKYPTCTRYLLPIIHREDGTERLQYRRRLLTVNRNLKKVGEMAGLSARLTTYVARHAWATLALKKDMPLTLISQALGHDNDHTTRIYLDLIELERINALNRLILSEL